MHYFEVYKQLNCCRMWFVDVGSVLSLLCVRPLPLTPDTSVIGSTRNQVCPGTSTTKLYFFCCTTYEYRERTTPAVKQTFLPHVLGWIEMEAVHKCSYICGSTINSTHTLTRSIVDSYCCPCCRWTLTSLDICFLVRCC